MEINLGKTFGLLFLIVLLIGGVVGWLVKPTPKPDNTYETLLNEERIARSLERDSLTQVIDASLYLRALDSVVIHDLKSSIKEDGVRVEKLKKELKQMTTDEKLTYLFNRYNFKP